MRSTSLNASAISACRLRSCRRASRCIASDISGVKKPAICLRPARLGAAAGFAAGGGGATGSTLRARDTAFKTLVADELSRAVWPHVAAGRLKPVIDTSFPLAEAAQAHRRMESGAHMGKIVLTVGG